MAQHVFTDTSYSKVGIDCNVYCVESLMFLKLSCHISGERQPFPLVPKIGICALSAATGGSTCRESTIADSNMCGIVDQVLGLPIEP
jgi:hypothetical protein